MSDKLHYDYRSFIIITKIHVVTWVSLFKQISIKPTSGFKVSISWGVFITYGDFQCKLFLLCIIRYVYSQEAERYNLF